jgi:hypothetical protein
MSDYKKVVVTLHKGVNVNIFLDDMTTLDTDIPYIPSRAVEIENIKPESLYNVNFWLTQEEAELLREEPRVRDIRIGSKEENGLILRNFAFSTPLPENRSGAWSSSNNDVNWGLAASSSITNPFSGGDLANYSRPYTLDGTGVDVVIMDTGLQINHPEFQNSQGVSRVQLVDWSSYSNISSVTAQSGNIVTFSHASRTSAIPTSTRVSIAGANNNAFNTIATVTVSNVISTTVDYGANLGNALDPTSFSTVYDPVIYYFATGNVATEPNFYTDVIGHGTYIGGVVAGKNYGWAPNANIYVMNILGTNTTEAFSPTLGINLITAWHNLKPITSTGYKRPTVVNCSWGFGLNVSRISSVKYRNYNLNNAAANAPVGVTWNSSNAAVLQSAGLVSLGNNYQSSNIIPARTTAIDSDFEDAVAAGVIVVGAAGNESFFIERGGATFLGSLVSGSNRISLIDNISNVVPYGNGTTIWANTSLISSLGYNYITGIDYANANITMANTVGTSSRRQFTVGGVNYFNLVGTDGNASFTPYHRGSSPSAVEGVICVGAIDNASEQKIDYSNTGNRIDVFAPGNAITSACSNTYTLTDVRPYFANTAYNAAKAGYSITSANLAGTSVSSAQVSGILACLLQARPRYRPADCLQWLYQNSVANRLTNTGSDYTAWNSLQQAQNRYLYNTFTGNIVSNTNIITTGMTGSF